METKMFCYQCQEFQTEGLEHAELQASARSMTI